MKNKLNKKELPSPPEFYLDVDTDFIEEARKLCSEFATNHTSQYHSVLSGFDTLSTECHMCQLGLLCMELGNRETLKSKVQNVKDSLGIDHFYDESLVKTLTPILVSQFVTAIQDACAKNGYILEDKLKSVIQRKVKEDMKSLDPKIATNLYTNIIRIGNFINNDGKISCK